VFVFSCVHMLKAVEPGCVYPAPVVTAFMLDHWPGWGYWNRTDQSNQTCFCVCVCVCAHVRTVFFLFQLVVDEIW